MEAGNFAAARPLFEQAHRLAPDEPSPLGNLARLAYQAGDRAAACGYFDAAERVARAGGRLAELDVISFLAVELRSPLEADTFLYALLQAHPLAAVSLNTRAILLRRAGLYADALQHAERALQINPTYAKAYVQKANALAHLKRHAEALDAAERALALDDSLIGAEVAAGMALGRLGRREEARRRLERALARWPGHETLMRALQAVIASS
jgi:tetratricopeptide (TPR) repeat protein